MAINSNDMVDFTPIIEVVESVLGKSRKGVQPNGWTEYDCPTCASIAGNNGDGKYNLCVNYSKNVYHCWKCLEKGRLNKLVRIHGGERYLYAFNEAIKVIKATNEYQLVGIYEDDNVNLNNLKTLILPNNFKYINKNDYSSKRAYEYLQSRGINDWMIKRYKIGYVGYFASENREDWKVRNKIVVPSYNSYGEIDYWIARDYTGKAKQKYHNAQLEKKDIVFNEGLVNWYEDLTLVEGVFDHFAIPNSIPLLGKSLTRDSATYKAVVENAKAQVNILLDDDARDDAIRIYKLLKQTPLSDRVRVIFPPQGYDAALMFEKYGKRGIAKLLSSARELNPFECIQIPIQY